jgi:small subunit ribosomal protein S20
MPLTGTALKRVKIATRNRARKRPLRSEAKTRVRHAREAIAVGERDEAAGKLKDALRKLDRAATRGALHRRNAARRKSRIQRAFNKAFDV